MESLSPKKKVERRDGYRYFKNYSDRPDVDVDRVTPGVVFINLSEEENQIRVVIVHIDIQGVQQVCLLSILLTR